MIVELDESEMGSRIGKERGIKHMMVLHVTLHCIDSNKLSTTINLVCAPAWMKTTTAEGIAACVAARLPCTFEKIKSKCKHLNVAPLTDSARACTRYGRHTRGCTSVERRIVDNQIVGVTGVHPVCLAHQGHHCNEYVLTVFKISSQIFSGCVLMQRSKYKRALQNKVARETWLMQPSYEEPLQINYEFLLDTFEQLEWRVKLGHLSEFGELRDLGKAAERKARRERLSRHLAASTFDHNGIITVLKIHCPLGCHATLSEGRNSVNADLHALHWEQNGGVPVHNRWLVNLPAWSHWNVNSKLGCVGRCWKQVGDSSACMQAAPTLAEEVQLVDVGYKDEEEFNRRERARFKGSDKICEASNSVKLATGTKLLELTVSVLGQLFLAARFRKIPDFNISMFIVKGRSPAIRVMIELGDYLRDPTHRFWFRSDGIPALCASPLTAVWLCCAKFR